MGNLKWFLKQLLPLTYASNYSVDGKHYVSYWKMWLGKTYNHKMFEVEKEVSMKTVYGQ